jgi:hypothetical protein
MVGSFMSFGLIQRDGAAAGLGLSGGRAGAAIARRSFCGGIALPRSSTLSSSITSDKRVLTADTPAPPKCAAPRHASQARAGREKKRSAARKTEPGFSAGRRPGRRQLHLIQRHPAG